MTYTSVMFNDHLLNLFCIKVDFLLPSKFLQKIQWVGDHELIPNLCPLPSSSSRSWSKKSKHVYRWSKEFWQSCEHLKSHEKKIVSLWIWMPVLLNRKRKTYHWATIGSDDGWVNNWIFTQKLILQKPCNRGSSISDFEINSNMPHLWLWLLWLAGIDSHHQAFRQWTFTHHEAILHSFHVVPMLRCHTWFRYVNAHF